MLQICANCAAKGSTGRPGRVALNQAQWVVGGRAVERNYWAVANSPEVAPVRRGVRPEAGLLRWPTEAATLSSGALPPTLFGALPGSLPNALPGALPGALLAALCGRSPASMPMKK